MVLCKCEIATITPATGIVAIESKWCASCAWLTALSGATGALQQFTSLTGAPGAQFAPQHSVVEQAIADGRLKLSGRSTATRSMAIKRTSITVTRITRTHNNGCECSQGRSRAHA